MNPGTPSDGATGPLWLLPMAAAVALGLDPIATAKTVGLACAIAAAAWAVLVASRRSGGRIAAPVTAAVVALQPTLAIWSVAGLETSAATLALTAICFLCGDAGSPRGSRRNTGAGALVAVLAWLRPEAVAAGGAVLLWSLARAPEGRARRAALGAVAIAAAGCAGAVAFRVAMFGHALPLSFHAKPGDLGHGFEYVLRGSIVITGVLGLVPAIVAARRGRALDRTLAVAIAVHLATVALVGGDWMPGFRLLAPVVPAWAVLVGRGTALLLRSRSRSRAAVALACALAACAVPAFDLVAQLPEARAAGRIRERAGEAVARYLAAHGDSFAAVDVGYLGYRTDLRVVDLSGLTEPVVAYADGGHVSKEIDPGWLDARDPDLIVLHSVITPSVDDAGNLVTLPGAFPVERTVAAMGLVRERYRFAAELPYAPGYRYVILARRE